MKRDPGERPGYTSPMKLFVKDGVASASRDSGRVRESLSGKVSEDGQVVLEGTGQLKESGASWRYRYEGRIAGAKLEATGGMYPPHGGPALRDCSIALTRVGPPAPRASKPPAVEKKAEPVKAEPERQEAKPAVVDAKPPPAEAKAAPAEPPQSVQAALQSPPAESEPPPHTYFGRYSESDLALLAIFAVCAVAGVGLIVYDWRRTHRRY